MKTTVIKRWMATTEVELQVLREKCKTYETLLRKLVADLPEDAFKPGGWFYRELIVAEVRAKLADGVPIASASSRVHRSTYERWEYILRTKGPDELRGRRRIVSQKRHLFDPRLVVQKNGKVCYF